MHVQALDIVSVDGQPVGPENFAARDLVTEIAALDRSVRPDEIGTPWPIQSPGFFSDASSQGCVHLAFEMPGANSGAGAGAGVAPAGAYPAAAAPAGAYPAASPAGMTPAAAAGNVPPGGAASPQAPPVSEAAAQASSSPAPGSAQPAGGGYVNPLPHDANIGRTDMGVDVDLKPGEPIVAPGNSRVLGIMQNWYAGQPYVALQFLDGPMKGHNYYVAEQINLAVSVGQIVRAGQPIAHYAASGTGIEMGWAGPDWQQTLAQAQGNTGDASHNDAPAGESFRRFLNSLANRAAPSPAAGAVSGPADAANLPGQSPSAAGPAGGADPGGAMPGTPAAASPAAAGATPAAGGATPAAGGATPAVAGATPAAGGATPAVAGATPSVPPSTPGATGAPPGAPGAAPVPPGTAPTGPPTPSTAQFHALQHQGEASKLHTVKFLPAVAPPPGSPLAQAQPPGAVPGSPTGQPVAEQIPGAQAPGGGAPGVQGPGAQIGQGPGGGLAGQLAGQAPAPTGSVVSVTSHLLTSGQQTFAARLASLTGLDPRVVAAWELAEESGGAAQARQAASNFNWLNIGYFDSGAGKIAFAAAFSNPVSAAEETARFLKGTWGGASASIRAILSTVGKDPQEQMMAIANSDWASSHYGGGANLRGTYDELADIRIQTAPAAAPSAPSPPA